MRKALVYSSTIVVISLVFAVNATADEIDLFNSSNLVPAAGGLNSGTNNILNYTSFQSGSFTLPLNPSGILELVNNTGTTLNTISFTLTGTQLGGNNTLTCGVAQAGSATCTVMSSIGTSSIGSLGTVGALNSPTTIPLPWTWNFSNAGIANGSNFELHFGSFNSSVQVAPTPVPEPASWLLLLVSGGVIFVGGIWFRTVTSRSALS